MKSNKFDTHAKNLLDDHEEYVNTSALWDNVQANLYPQKKKKRLFWIWFSASGIAALILLSGYVYFSRNTYSVGTIIEAKQLEKSSTALKDTSTQIVIEPVSQINTANNHDKSNIFVKPLEDISLRNIKSKDKINPVKKYEHSHPIQHTVISGTTNSFSQNQTTSPKKKTPFTAKINHQSINKNSTKLIESQKNNTSEPNNGPQNDKAIETKISIAEEVKIIADSTIQIHSKKDIVIPETEKSNAVATETENASEEKISRKLKRNLKLGVGFRTGISSSLTTLTAKNENVIPLTNLRRQTESNLETIDIGIDVLLKHKSGLYMSTGIDYIKATRKLVFNKDLRRTDSVVGIANIYVNPITMDSTYIEGKVEQITTSIRNKEVYNNLHLVNIPFNLGATIDYQQWTFGIQGGAMLNILLKHKGQIMNSESTFYDLKNDDANWFKDNLGFSFQGAALIGYNFSDNFQVIGGPSFRSPLIISEDINPIKQSQVGLGLQLNARYWFD